MKMDIAGHYIARARAQQARREDNAAMIIRDRVMRLRHV